MIIIILRALATSVPITALMMIPTSIAAVQRVMAAVGIQSNASSSSSIRLRLCLIIGLILLLLGSTAIIRRVIMLFMLIIVGTATVFITF